MVLSRKRFLLSAIPNSTCTFIWSTSNPKGHSHEIVRFSKRVRTNERHGREH